MFVTWIYVSNIIPTFWLTHGSLNIPGSIIRKFVHQTVLHGWKDLIVDSITVPTYVVFLLNVWIYTTTDSNHPQELVDIISTVMTDTTINDQNIINIKFITNLECFILRWWHRQTNCSNVSIVPCIVINQSCSVRKSCNLVTIIPPWHNNCFLLGVHSQPIISLTIIINYVSLTSIFRR